MESQFKYCPRCASNMAFSKSEYDHVERNTCMACGYIDYNNSKPAASALIVNDKNEVLLVKRAWYPFKGLLDIPGGFVEGGEHPEDGCKRELMEELGVKGELDELFDIEMDVYADGTEESVKNVSGHGVYVMSIYYMAHIVSGDIKPTDEIAGYEWVPVKRLPAMIDNVAFTANQNVLKKLYYSGDRYYDEPGKIY